VGLGAKNSSEKDAYESETRKKNGGGGRHHSVAGNAGFKNSLSGGECHLLALKSFRGLPQTLRATAKAATFRFTQDEN